MQDNDRISGTNILMAVAAGAAVGAGLALLFAPCSGRQTREWLAHRTRDIKERTTSAFEQGKESIRRAAKDIGRDAESVATTLRG